MSSATTTTSDSINATVVIGKTISSGSGNGNQQSYGTLTIDQVVDAVQKGDLDMVHEAITNQGMSPNVKDHEDCTLLHWAAINNRTLIVELLLKLGADVNLPGGINQEIPLQWAVRRGDTAKIVSMLIIHKSDLLHRSIYGYDSLYLTIQAGHVHIAYLLLNAGAQVNTIDYTTNSHASQQNTVMHYLIYEITKSTPPSVLAGGNASTSSATTVTNENRIDLVRLLLRFGADLTLKNVHGLTPIHILAKYGTYQELDLAFAMCSEAMYSGLFRLWGRSPSGSPASGGKSGIGNNDIEMATAGGNNGSSTSAIESPFQMAWKERNKTMIKFFFDFYMYAYLPFSFPIFITAFTFASVFPLLDYYGWFQGVCLIAFPSWFLADMLSQSTLIAKNSRASAGVAWGVIFALSYCYFHHIARYYEHNFNSMVMIIVAIIFVTLWKSMKTLPLHLSHGLAESNGMNNSGMGIGMGISESTGNGSSSAVIGGSLADKIITSEVFYSSQNTSQYAGLKFKFCATCLTDRSLASIHCSKCNLCVVDLDHHCPFVCNCVGRGNRRMFTFFTLFAAIGCLIVAVTIFMAEYDHFCIHEGNKSYSFYYVQQCMLLNHPSLLFGSWLGLNCFIWIFSIFWGQISMVGAETTTFEVIRKHNYGRDCMSLRSFRNIFTFLKTGAYSVSQGDEDHDHNHEHSDESSVPLLVAEMREKEKEREKENREWGKERERSSKVTPITASAVMRSSKGGSGMEIV